jgi:hypothetical protein
VRAAPHRMKSSHEYVRLASRTLNVRLDLNQTANNYVRLVSANAGWYIWIQSVIRAVFKYNHRDAMLLPIMGRQLAGYGIACND